VSPIKCQRLLIGTFLMGFITAQAAPSSAGWFWRDVSVASCDWPTVGGGVPSAPSHHIIVNDFGLRTDGPTGAPISLICPLPDDSCFPKWEIDRANVRGRSDGGAGAGVAAVACITYFDSNVGGACGEWRTNIVDAGPVPVGNYNIFLDLSKWGTGFGGHFPYIVINTPAGGANNVKGIRLEGNFDSVCL
jgi:hypothetical protein